MSPTTLGAGESTGGRFRQDGRYHIKRHYDGTHQSIDPTGIVPAGPQLDLDAPHARG